MKNEEVVKSLKDAQASIAVAIKVLTEVEEPVPEVPISAKGWAALIESYKKTSGVSDALKVASLAQWILESGRGSSDLAKKHNNYGGIKFRPELAGYATPVSYDAHDGLDNYADFESNAKFIQGFWAFINRSPYKGYEAFENDALGFIKHIKKAGYAESPNYVEKVSALFAEAKKLLGIDSLEEIDDDPESPDEGEDRSIDGVFVFKVGHLAKAKGASMIGGPNEYDYYKTNIAPKMLAYAKEKYPKMKIHIVYRDGTNISGAYATRIKPLNPDAVIEGHYNGSASSAASGTETLCSADSNDKAFATIVQKRLCAVFGRNGMSRGVKPISKSINGGTACHALPGIPNCLIEPGFGSNPSDAKIMMSKQQEIAEALVESFADVLRG